MNWVDRADQILFHPKYQYALEEIEKWDKERQFCRHGIGHFLDVARLTYIHCLEAGVDVGKDVVYAAALLHDIGRYRQYEAGIPHEEASASLADEILPECSFSEEEQAQIRDAILGHRRKEAGAAKGSALAELLCRADKLSRNCFACAVREACNWPKDKMNMGIRD